MPILRRRLPLFGDVLAPLRLGLTQGRKGAKGGAVRIARSTHLSPKSTERWERQATIPDADNNGKSPNIPILPSVPQRSNNLF